MNKKAVSEMVSYVMLVVITIGVSVVVYSFLSAYILKKPPVECPDGAGLIIQDYKCDTVLNILNLTLKNSGTYTLSGFVLKASNTTRSPSMPLKWSGNAIDSEQIFFIPDELAPGKSRSLIFNYNAKNVATELFIEPIYSTKSALCGQAIIIQKINGCN